MKKLIFSALLAFVAIGGATAQTTYFYTSASGSGSFQCTGISANCAAGLPSGATIHQDSPDGPVVTPASLPSQQRVDL